MRIKRSVNTNTRSMFFGVVRRNLHNCPRSVRETTYKSLVRPTLEYGSAAWDLYYEKDIQKLERIQRKTARFCAGNYSYYASVTEMLQELKAGVDVNLSEFLQSLRKWLKGKQVLEHHWSALQEIRLDTLRGATKINFTEIYSV